MGKVERILTSKDGQSRGVEVTEVTGHGSRRTSLLKRPVQLLYPLEVSCSTNPETSQEQVRDVQEPSLLRRATGVRERRRAAVEEERLRRRWIAELQDEH